MNEVRIISSHGDALAKPMFLRVKDVSAIYGLKRGFLYNMVKAGHLKSTTLKGRCGMKGIVLFRPEDIEKMIQSSEGQDTQ
jgi:predicted DNA-binding transcriptional regulator AlpA